MIKLYAFGDSWMVGHKGDFYKHFLERNETPTHNMKDYGEYENYLKNTTSVPALLSKYYNLELVNSASGGSGNFPQLDKLFRLLTLGKISKNDIVFFGLTSTYRDRSCMGRSGYVEDVLRPDMGEFIVDRDLFKNQTNELMIYDHFLLLSTLEKLQQVYNFKLLVMNLWNNPINDLQFLHDCKWKSLMGGEFLTNTWYDIIRENYGNAGSSFWCSPETLDEKFKNLMAWDHHPNQLGYEKIVTWFINNRIISNLIDDE
jgi:hypothetical protein